MHHESGHGEQAMEASEHGVLAHAVVMLAGEVGFKYDEVRYEHLATGMLDLSHVAAGDLCKVQRLAGEQSHDHGGIQRRLDLRRAHPNGR